MDGWIGRLILLLDGTTWRLPTTLALLIRNGADKLGLCPLFHDAL